MHDIALDAGNRRSLVIPLGRRAAWSAEALTSVTYQYCVSMITTLAGDGSFQCGIESE